MAFSSAEGSRLSLGSSLPFYSLQRKSPKSIRQRPINRSIPLLATLRVQRKSPGAVGTQNCDRCRTSGVRRENLAVVTVRCTPAARNPRLLCFFVRADAEFRWPREERVAGMAIRVWRWYLPVVIGLRGAQSSLLTLGRISAYQNHSSPSDPYKREREDTC